MSDFLPATTTVADVLAIRGRAGWLTPPLVCFSPPPVAVLGHAVTVTMEPGPPHGGGAFEPLYELLSTDLAGSVVVVAGVDMVPAAVWGQILSRAARTAGAVGALIDGGVRDVRYLAGEGLPVWGAAERTVGAVGLAHVDTVGAPVQVAGVRVAPGDVVLLDGDGVVALAAESADDVLADARRYEEAEDAVLGDLARGEKLVDAYRHKRAAVRAIKEGGG